MLKSGQHVRDDPVVNVAGKSGMSTHALQREAPVVSWAAVFVERAMIGFGDLVAAPKAVDTGSDLRYRKAPLSQWSSWHRSICERIKTQVVAEA